MAQFEALRFGSRGVVAGVYVEYAKEEKLSQTDSLSNIIYRPLFAVLLSYTLELGQRRGEKPVSWL